MKIIFLDIDGVLNSVEGITEFYGNPIRKANNRFIERNLVNSLRKIVFENKLHIVISSTWRKLDIDYMDYFPKCLVDRIVGKTPYICKMVDDGGGRGSEIKLWLSKHPEVTSFVIVDDDSFDIINNDDLISQFVHINRDKGLLYHLYENKIKDALANMVIAEG